VSPDGAWLVAAADGLPAARGFGDGFATLQLAKVLAGSQLMLSAEPISAPKVEKPPHLRAAASKLAVSAGC
jgi:hypothetical protein